MNATATETTTTTLKTRIHYYRFNTKNPAEANAYKSMLAEIESNCPEARGHWMNCLTDPKTDRTKAHGTVEEIEIEPACLFENQWNSTTARVFDHYECIYWDARHIKSGHWLEITPEMAAARRDTHKCGYCGHHYGPFHQPIPGEFCPACLDSAYLTTKDLHLTRLLPLVGHQQRPELTTEELAEIMPKYVERQTTGSDSRNARKLAQQRQDIIKKYAETTASAKNEHDGQLWLLDHNFPLDNVIYYNHTGKFSFGWRTPVEPAVEARLLEIISEFHYPYEIKCQDGRKLEGNIE